MSKISVILNCLNCTSYLREAIDSIYAQTYVDWEIILWDNASSEDVKSYLTGYDNRLHYYRASITANLGEARNLAMSKAQGDLIAFLDCDDIWMPEKLRLSILPFEDPEVGLVYTNWTIFNATGYSKLAYDGIPSPEGWVFKELLFNNFTCLSTLIFRADILHKDQIYFDSQFTYLEDTDFLIKVARKWKLSYVPVSLTNYRMHANSASATKVEGFRKEMDMLIDKFSALYPEVAEKYADHLRMVNRKDSAMDYWRKGDRRRARSVIYVDLGVNPKYTLFYLAMFIPFRYIDWLRQRIFRKSIGYYH